MLDLECPDGDPNCLYPGEPGIVDGATIVARALAWLETVERRTGRKPIIYSFPSYFDGLAADTSKLAAYPLFIATLGNCASVPAPWMKAAFWQYSWTGIVPGIVAEVDLDRFIGTIDDLAGSADAGSPPPGSDGATSDVKGSDGDGRATDGDADVLAETGNDRGIPSDSSDAWDANATAEPSDGGSGSRLDGPSDAAPGPSTVENGCACSSSAPPSPRPPVWLVLALGAALCVRGRSTRTFTGRASREGRRSRR
jgi:MYXO-CTERM domain-containing protein